MKYYKIVITVIVLFIVIIVFGKVIFGVKDIVKPVTPVVTPPVPFYPCSGNKCP